MWFKSQLYMECASHFIHRFQKVHPNLVTFFYIFLGVLGAGLLCVPNKLIVFIGLFVLYFKGIPDWADGQIARMQNKTSKFGGKLDTYSGYIVTVCFYIGLSVYMSYHINLYIIPWLLMIICLVKLFGVKISHAWVIDLIIFSVGVHVLVT